MKITIEVDSWEELSQVAEQITKRDLQREIGLASITGSPKAEETPEKMPVNPPEEKKAEKPKKAAKKAEEKDDDPFIEPGPSIEERADAAVEEGKINKVITKLRGKLKEVNTKEGRNIAKEWIEQLGYKSLAEIKDLEKLGQLEQLAEETLNA